jgi:hypothetical protein
MRLEPRRPGLCIAILAALITVSVFSAAAKELATGTGAFIDMPSGFTPGEGDGKTRFSYFAPDGGMELDILIFEPSRYNSVEAMATDLLGQMGSKGEISPSMAFPEQDMRCSSRAARRTAMPWWPRRQPPGSTSTPSSSFPAWTRSP